MPSRSKSQQRLMGMVAAAQKGDLKHPSGKVKSMAASIAPDKVTHFAATKHKKLPEHVKKAAGLPAMLGDLAGKLNPKAILEHWSGLAALRRSDPTAFEQAFMMGSKLKGLGQAPVSLRAVPEALGAGESSKGFPGLAAAAVSRGITPGRMAAAGATGAGIGSTLLAAQNNKPAAISTPGPVPAPKPIMAPQPSQSPTGASSRYSDLFTPRNMAIGGGLAALGAGAGYLAGHRRRDED